MLTLSPIIIIPVYDFCFKESLRLVQYLPLFFSRCSLLCILWWVNYFQERWTFYSSAKSHGGPGLPGEWLGFASKLGHPLRIQRWVEKSRYPEMFPILPSENFACCLLVPYCHWLFSLCPASLDFQDSPLNRSASRNEGSPGTWVPSSDPLVELMGNHVGYIFGGLKVAFLTLPLKKIKFLVHPQKSASPRLVKHKCLGN